jgi:CheY-like chemotaxis protein
MQWEVRDSGIGVAADKLGQLFVEFTQADESIARRFGGSGLGLAISRRIIEQMGGEIQVESRPGEGSTFRFDVTLPQAAGPALETPAPRTDQPERFRAALRRLGRPMRVLLAEDNTTNQFVVKLLLRGFDVVIDTVGDGRAALNSASTASYDAICMDMLMPEMDGLQATRAIRDLGGQAATMPIIAMTANAFAEDIQACMEAGMTHFVAKPVSRDKLLQALEDALAAPPLARAA